MFYEPDSCVGVVIYPVVYLKYNKYTLRVTCICLRLLSCSVDNPDVALSPGFNFR